MAQRPQPKHNRDRRPAQPRPFWSHLQYDTGASNQEGMNEQPFHEPLLPSRGSSHHHQQQPQYRYGNQPRSLIPWSPGETLASDAPPTALSSFPHVHLSDDNHLVHDDNDEEESTSLLSPGGCCWAFCWCCRCWYGSSSRRDDDDLQHHHHHERSDRRRRRGGGTRNFCMKVAHLLVALATFAVLYHVSDKCNDQSWTMNAGESRHVATAGFLTDSVQVVSQSISPSSSHDGDDDYYGNHTTSNKGSSNNNTETISRGMAVYAMGSPHCPLLNGPPVIIDAPSQKLELMHNAFEYQYFYLNEGSKMHVTVQQKRGATNILVLRGSKVLARIQNKRKSPSHHAHNNPHHQSDVISDLELAFTTDQIIYERFSYQENAPIEFSFTSPANDVYVLLYDNAAMNEPATLDVKYHMALTTYNLKGLVPWCSHTSPLDTDEVASFTCPPLEVAKAGCIIVEAVEKHAGNETYVQVGERIVDVRIYATRNWIYIGVMTLLPVLVLALVLFCRKKGRKRRRRRWQERNYQRIPQSNSRVPVPQERPNFQYLPPYQQEGGDAEGTPNSEEAGNSNVGETSPSTRQAARVRARSDENHRSVETTTMVPAENVVLVNE